MSQNDGGNNNTKDEEIEDQNETTVHNTVDNNLIAQLQDEAVANTDTKVGKSDGTGTLDKSNPQTNNEGTEG